MASACLQTSSRVPQTHNVQVHRLASIRSASPKPDLLFSSLLFSSLLCPTVNKSVFDWARWRLLGSFVCLVVSERIHRASVPSCVLVSKPRSRGRRKEHDGWLREGEAKYRRATKARRSVTNPKDSQRFCCGLETPACTLSGLLHLFNGRQPSLRSKLLLLRFCLGLAAPRDESRESSGFREIGVVD